MKWIIATSALLILSQPAFSQQQRPCQQGDIGQTGINPCRSPDILGGTIDRSGNFNMGTNPGAATPGSGGPVVVPNDPLATGLLPNPLVGSPGATGLGTAGPQAQIPTQVPAPTTTTPPTGSGGSTTGGRAVGSPPRTSPSTSTGSAGRTVGKGATGTAGATTGTSTTTKSATPSTSMGSGGSALGTRGGNHAIRPMGGSHALHSHSHR